MSVDMSWINGLRVGVVYADTWGRGGQRWNALNLTSQLRRQQAVKIESYAIEHHSPSFKRFGILRHEMSRSTTQSVNAISYEDWVSHVWSQVGGAFELEDPALAIAQELLGTLPLQDHDHWICTKGLLAQLVSTVIGESRTTLFLTNPGLLQLRLHRPTRPVQIIVPEPSWQAALNSAEVSNYPTIYWNPMTNLAHNVCSHLKFIPDSDHGYSVILIANGDGIQWDALLTEITALSLHRIIFVAVRDLELLERVRSCLNEDAVSRIEFRTWIDIEELSTDISLHPSRAVIVTKAGPGTVHALTSAGFRPILLDSGQEPEKWVLKSAMLENVATATTPNCLTREIQSYIENHQQGVSQKAWTRKFEHAGDGL
jgi:hypothetical protein